MLQMLKQQQRRRFHSPETLSQELAAFTLSSLVVKTVKEFV